MCNTNINYAGIDFKNPIVLASGTCGFGNVLDEIFPIEKLGGISSKGLTLDKRPGNEGIRIWETSSGIMNSVGLENPGVEGFIDKYLDFINKKNIVNIVNINGHSIDEYLKEIEILNREEIDIIELNIACPNIKGGGLSFGVKTEIARELLREVRRICRHKLVVKLSPNAEDIVDLAVMCEDEGADGVSLINSFLAMAVDIKNKKPVFNNVYAGLTGPAIKPVALRMVHQVSKAVSIPIMGQGGISTWEDAIEFLMVGARVLQVGSATFAKPDVSLDIINGIEKYLKNNKLDSIEEIIGII